MQNSFAMPDVGEGLAEAELVGWRVSVGDQVTINQILVEVETAKAVVELPSPYAGTVAELLHGPGDVVAVGTPIIVISDGTDETAPPSAPAAGRGAASDAGPGRQPVLVGYGTSQARISRRPRRATTAISAPLADPQPAVRNHATPPVRKLARELGVDLVALTPTGARGQVTRADVLSAGSLGRPAVAAAEPGEFRSPVKGVRRHIADAMVTSAFTAPHVTEWLTVDVT